MRKQFRKGHSIQDAIGRHAALAGHFDAPVHVVELPDGMGVGIDAEYATIAERFLMPPPVKVKAPRMRVDFNRYAVFRAGLQDLIDIDLVSRTPLQRSSGHMSDNRRIWIFDRSQNALGLFLLRQFEPAVNARDHKIEVFQDIVRIIERAVREYVSLDPFQDAEFAPVALA
jgi:hypothetical protein